MSKTLFFEYSSVEELSEYFLEHYQHELQKAFLPAKLNSELIIRRRRNGRSFPFPAYHPHLPRKILQLSV
ncbi:hypothetical protein QNN00_20920 [Bacillus velezensis]|nr:hypothetical protein [Bacillus velezensis]